MDPLVPDRQMFAQDPFGYSSSAWQRWAMIGAALGKDVDPTSTPKAEDLKNPILWLSQAEAMSQAAKTLIEAQPSFENMPVPIQGICDSQFSAIAMMLLGYSLEISLKAMHILKHGVDKFIENEKQFYHHRLRDLAEFIPDLTEKDRAILDVLTHFTMWAGRYPDPGRANVNKHELVFSLSEKHEICLRDVLDLATRVMRQTAKVTTAN